ncbi:MAG: DUF1501 domain-containing protein [Ferruginibacter sp.]
MKRRKFIRSTTIAAAAVPSFVNGFSLTAHAEDSLTGKLLLSGTPNDHVLVLIQLSGGNDGLNTVIPIDQYSNYVNARSNIAIPQNKILSLTGTATTGLHPSLTGLRDLYDNGNLCIVQSVGYPNPNFSHFRATDIWNTASASDQFLQDGWLGRYLNTEYPGFPAGYPNTQMPDPLAIQFGTSASLALIGPSASMTYTISDPNAIVSGNSGGQDPVATDTPMGMKLAYVRGVSKQAEVYSSVIQAAFNRPGNNNMVTYPSNTLASQLRTVARLINGGLQTKVYVVSMKGFDTHALQVNTGDTTTGNHATLLATVSDSVKAFQADLKSMGKDQRVLGMTYSEFGRRIKSNTSNGTDHGYAAPLFIFGSQVTPGIIGANPVLPSAVTVSDNIPMQYDFRSVYYSIMKRWLCQDTTSLQQIMLQNFTELDVCINTDCAPLGQPAVNERNIITANPNPAKNDVQLNFYTEGGHTLLQLMSKEGLPLQTLLEATYNQPQKISKTVHVGSYKPGLYYVRFQNGKNRQMKPIIKL